MIHDQCEAASPGGGELDDDEIVEPGDRGVLPAGAVVGGYRIERAIAEGGMATVYDAVHEILPRRAAVKVLHRYLLGKWAARERLLQEARILEALRHPGVVAIYDAGQLPDGRPWLAMELLEGMTLAQRILLRGQLDPLDVIELLDRAIVALEVAHANGVVHRDLKPDNIILQRTPAGLNVKLIDWGIARVHGHDPTGRLTRANMTPGTPLYMSPEQARGKRVDARTDIYALGVIACEALCGEPPFKGETPLDVVIQHLTTAPPRPSLRCPRIPRGLEDLVLRMLAKDAGDRPGADAIRAELAVLSLSLRDDPDGAPAPAEDAIPEPVEYEELSIQHDAPDDELDAAAVADEVIELTTPARARWTPPLEPDDAALRGRDTAEEPLRRRRCRTIGPGIGRRERHL